MKHRRRLYPAHIARKQQQIYIADTETWKHGKNFAFLYLESLHDSENNIFFSPSAFLQWCKQKTQSRNIIIYFHNSQFDLSSILIDMEVFKSRKIEVGSRIIRLQYKIHGKHSKMGIIEFRDSLSLLPLSVAQLGESLNFPKGKTPEKFLQTTPCEITPDDIQYCIQDVRIVKTALLSLLTVYRSAIGDEEGRLPLTLAKMAYTVWSHFFKDEFGEEKYWYINDEINEMFRKSYYGGRVECFFDGPTMGDFEFKEFSYYDINSEYPFVMAEYEYPDFRDGGSIWRGVRGKDDLVSLMINDFVVADIVLKHPEGEFCNLFLPCRGEDGVLQYHSDRFEGCLCHPELELALQLGWEVVDVRAVGTVRKIRPFRRYVDYFYNMRMEAKSKGDSREYIYKILLNSLYGKFGQKDRGEEIVDDDIISRMEEEGKVVEVLNKEGEVVDRVREWGGRRWKKVVLDMHNRYYVSLDDHIQCRNQWFGFASAVTSYARCYLHRLIMDNRDNVVYVDTDGIQVLGDKFVGDIGKGLGQIKLEYRGIGYWYDKKNYVHFINGESGLIMKARAKGIKDYSGNAFEKQVFERPLKYREAKVRGLQWGNWTECIKECKKIIKSLPPEVSLDHAKEMIKNQINFFSGEENV